MFNTHNAKLVNSAHDAASTSKWYCVKISYPHHFEVEPTSCADGDLKLLFKLMLTQWLINAQGLNISTSKNDEYTKFIRKKINAYTKFLCKRNRGGLEILMYPESILYRVPYYV